MPKRYSLPLLYYRETGTAKPAGVAAILYLLVALTNNDGGL
jgi:hypothetical protein